MRSIRSLDGDSADDLVSESLCLPVGCPQGKRRERGARSESKVIGAPVSDAAWTMCCPSRRKWVRPQSSYTSSAMSVAGSQTSSVATATAVGGSEERPRRDLPFQLAGVPRGVHR